MPAKSARVSEHGFGLMEVVIAAAIFAIIAAALSNNAVFSINAQRALEIRGDKEAFKKRILEHYSCYRTTTIPSTKCKNLGRIDLEDTSGETLLPKSGKTIGTWTYVAECVSTAGAINIRAVRLIENMFIDLTKKDLDHLDPNADPNLQQNYVKDPLTKKAITIKDPESFLFPDNKPLCVGNNYGEKLVPVYGNYPTGAPNLSFTKELGGKPQFITVFSPANDGIQADYCTINDRMSPNQHVCGPADNPIGNYSITLGPTNFTVSGNLLQASPSPGAYQEWVYFGFKDVAN